MDMLKILEENRKINDLIREENERYRNERKEINKRHQERVKTHTEFINESLYHNNELALSTVSHGKILESIKSNKHFGNIVVRFNDVILYDLATMQMLDYKKVYKIDSEGNKTVKDGLIVIDQKIDASDCEKFSYKAARNIYYLRELAYFYFKTYIRTSSEEFKENIDSITENGLEKMLKISDIETLFKFLVLQEEVNLENLDDDIGTIYSATKKVFEKKKNKGLL